MKIVFDEKQLEKILSAFEKFVIELKRLNDFLDQFKKRGGEK